MYRAEPAPEARWLTPRIGQPAALLLQIDPEYLIVPGTAIFITVLAFNLLGDGLRDAFDPKGSR